MRADETVPDLMENCPYCGAQQDVSSFFERRERRERRQAVKEEVALPEEDENEIVWERKTLLTQSKNSGLMKSISRRSGTRTSRRPKQRLRPLTTAATLTKLRWKT